MLVRWLVGVENVYTQHQPLLSQTMESIIKGRLRDVNYPFVGNHCQQERPQVEVIVVVGGTTYEELRSVALQNASISGTVLNSMRDCSLGFYLTIGGSLEHCCIQRSLWFDQLVN